MAHRGNPSQWPSWKSTQFDNRTSEQNTKQSTDPHVMYETVTLAGIPKEREKQNVLGQASSESVASFGIRKRNYSSLTNHLK